VGSQTSLTKKQKEKEAKQNGVHSPGRLEMVKVDIDTSMVRVVAVYSMCCSCARGIIGVASFITTDEQLQ